MTYLVPANFIVPLRLEHPAFIIRPLLIGDVIKDYDAVMSSVAHLQGIFGDDHAWPAPDLTLEQDLVDLGWHHKEFQRRTSFAYTVMSPDESQCLGCAYIYPHEDTSFEAKFYCWVRASHAQELDDELFKTLRDWLHRDWPFTAVAFPGRD